MKTGNSLHLLCECPVLINNGSQYTAESQWDFQGEDQWYSWIPHRYSELPIQSTES